MKINEIVSSQRLKLGFSVVDVAESVGVSTHTIDDVEIHEDEFTTVLKLSEAKKLASKLNFDLNRALELGGNLLASSQPRSQIIKDAMNRLNISPQYLAAELGFDEIAIRALITEADFIESWPIDLILETAKLVGLDPRLLLQ